MQIAIDSSVRSNIRGNRHVLDVTTYVGTTVLSRITEMLENHVHVFANSGYKVLSWMGLGMRQRWDVTNFLTIFCTFAHDGNVYMYHSNSQLTG